MAHFCTVFEALVYLSAHTVLNYFVSRLDVGKLRLIARLLIFFFLLQAGYPRLIVVSELVLVCVDLHGGYLLLQLRIFFAPSHKLFLKVAALVLKIFSLARQPRLQLFKDDTIIWLGHLTAVDSGDQAIDMGFHLTERLLVHPLPVGDRCELIDHMPALLTSLLDLLDLRQNYIAVEVLLAFSLLLKGAKFIGVLAAPFCKVYQALEQLDESRSQILRG